LDFLSSRRPADRAQKDLRDDVIHFARDSPQRAIGVAELGDPRRNFPALTLDERERVWIVSHVKRLE
jgi:hypothetical protein